MPESENTETPPVEIPEIAKTPDKAPEISAPDPATYKKKLDQLYWLRIIFAAASGIIATFAFDSIDARGKYYTSIFGSNFQLRYNTGYRSFVFILHLSCGFDLGTPIPYEHNGICCIQISKA